MYVVYVPCKYAQSLTKYLVPTHTYQTSQLLESLELLKSSVVNQKQGISHQLRES